MATTHYGLTLFEGTDHPTWLTDWNNTMVAIDSALYRIATGGGDLPDLTEIVTRLQALEGRVDSDELRLNVVEGDIVDILSDLSTVSSDLSALATRVTTTENNIDTLETAVNTTIPAQIQSINDSLSNILSSLTSINSRLTVLENNVNISFSDLMDTSKFQEETLLFNANNFPIDSSLAYYEHTFSEPISCIAYASNISANYQNRNPLTTSNRIDAGVLVTLYGSNISCKTIGTDRFIFGATSCEPKYAQQAYGAKGLNLKSPSLTTMPFLSLIHNVESIRVYPTIGGQTTAVPVSSEGLFFVFKPVV